MDRPSPDFMASVYRWSQDPVAPMLNAVWEGYQSLIREAPVINTGSLERSITQLLEPRVRRALSEYAPFYIQKECYEDETMAAPPAQPPAYDLAFVLREDERIKWPLEAKVLETPATLADYVADIREQFLTCRYAPFSSAGAMLGYLLSGTPDATFSNLEGQLMCQLDRPTTSDIGRPQRSSNHLRKVPTGRGYPAEFTCHHLLMSFTGVSRRNAAPRRRRTQQASAP